MSPWFQQVLFTVIPALAAGYFLRPVIEATVLRALTAGVLAGAAATIAALAAGYADPVLPRVMPVSFVIGFILALIESWIMKLRSP